MIQIKTPCPMHDYELNDNGDFVCRCCGYFLLIADLTHVQMEMYMTGLSIAERQFTEGPKMVSEKIQELKETVGIKT